MRSMCFSLSHGRLFLSRHLLLQLLELVLRHVFLRLFQLAIHEPKLQKYTQSSRDHTLTHRCPPEPISLAHDRQSHRHHKLSPPPRLSFVVYHYPHPTHLALASALDLLLNLLKEFLSGSDSFLSGDDSVFGSLLRSLGSFLVFLGDFARLDSLSRGSGGFLGRLFAFLHDGGLCNLRPLERKRIFGLERSKHARCLSSLDHAKIHVLRLGLEIFLLVCKLGLLGL
mmetsp:Transcript_17124/g.32496  ORF Transcript_17124/g.32496 Transcript_17124/m.32496 type:complete len:226 (+) Transcript_17124:301-978(+)